MYILIHVKKNNTHIYAEKLVIVTKDTANWHMIWLPPLLLSEFENKADWNELHVLFLKTSKVL